MAAGTSLNFTKGLLRTQSFSFSHNPDAGVGAGLFFVISLFPWFYRLPKIEKVS